MPLRLKCVWRLCYAVLCAVAAVLLGNALRSSDVSAQNRHIATVMPTTSTTQSQAVYRIGLWQGKAAVFREGCAAPELVTDVFAAALPLQEQQRLAKGFILVGEDALEALLEAYTS